MFFMETCRCVYSNVQMGEGRNEGRGGVSG